MPITFELKNLDVNINDTLSLKDISFKLKQGDVLAVLGPNGAGKSSLLKSIVSHYAYPIVSGHILFNNRDISKNSTDSKATDGIFYCNQNPIELPGVQMLEFYKAMTKNSKKSFYEFYKDLDIKMKSVGLRHELLKINVNVGLSGGEKKRNEILQAKVLEPKIMLIDEIDSGLDLDATKMVTDYINQNKKDWITIIVSHHIDFLKSIKPNKSIVLIDGKVVEKDKKDIVNFIEENGYKYFFNNAKKTSRTLPIKCCTNSNAK